MRCLFVLVLLLPLLTNAQDMSESSVSETTATERRPQRLELSLNSEIRHHETEMTARKSREGTSLYDVGIRAQFNVDEHLTLNFEGASEKSEGENIFQIHVASASWKPVEWGIIEAGQFFIPVGQYVARDQWFTELPSYYSQLLYWDRGIDVGVRAEVFPFSSPLLSLEAATFSGRTVRPGDERPGPAKSLPQLLSLRSRGEFHEAFVQKFEHEVSFSRALSATGLGAAAFYEFDWLSLRPEIWGELFRMNQNQASGPAEITEGSSITAQLSAISRLQFGVRLAQTKGRVIAQQFKQDLIPTEERTTFLQLRLHPAIKLRGEKREVAERLRKVDDLVLRAMLEFQIF